MYEWIISDEQGVAALESPVLVGEGESPVPPVGGPIAIRLHDLVVHNNKKWIDLFGGADIRVDVLAVQGNVLEDDPSSFYTPTTYRFGGVRDNQTLTLDKEGLLAFYGWPKHFIDLSVMVSRDTQRADDLAVLLQKETSSSEFSGALDAILQLAASGAALAIKNALSVAALMGGLAWKVLRAATSNTVGAYRGNRLEFPHQFGLGRNPEQGSYLRQNLSMWFEVIRASKTAAPTD
jgi:hypothetical protein